MYKRNRSLLERFSMTLISIALLIVIAIIALSYPQEPVTDEQESTPSMTADMEGNEPDAEQALADVRVPVSASVTPDAPSTEPVVEEKPPAGISPEPEPEPEPEPPPRRGFFEEIPQDVRESMAGISMPDGAKVTYDDLSYLTVYYHDFDGNHATGNIVVAKGLSDEVLDIFAELYDLGYPIECVKLIDEFNDKQTDELDSLDRASMGNNNTSSFCYRAMNSAGTLSQHAYGRAIDLNPKINPYVSGGSVSPANAVIYSDRSGEGLSEIEQRALIRKDDEVYKIFTSRGWKWGCEIWNGVYDYQHFQKTE